MNELIIDKVVGEQPTGSLKKGKLPSQSQSDNSFDFVQGSITKLLQKIYIYLSKHHQKQCSVLEPISQRKRGRKEYQEDTEWPKQVKKGFFLNKKNNTLTFQVKKMVVVFFKLFTWNHLNVTRTANSQGFSYGERTAVPLKT